MKKNKNYFSWIVFICFITTTIIMAFHHENWRDEAQAYLLCRDMNFIQLLKNIHYEGHPIFYYLFLFPLVKLGVGPKSVNILSFIFMSIAVYLILFKSKLNNLQKICIIISYPVLYEFSIIGRSYSLIFLLLVLWALLYPERGNKAILYSLVLGCLINTHLLMSCFVGVNALLFYYNEIIKKKNKSKKIYISLLIFCLLFVFLFIQFIPKLFDNIEVSTNKNNSFISIIMNILLFIFEGNGCYFFIVSIISVIIYTIIYIYIYKENKTLFYTLFINYIFMGIFTSLFVKISIYFLASGLSVLLAIIMALKDDASKDKMLTAYLILMSLLAIPNILIFYKNDYIRNYSAAYDTANFINKKLSNNSNFICNNDAHCSSIVPYTNSNFYNAHSQKKFTYIIWNNERQQEVNYKKLNNLLKKKTFYYIYIDNNEKNEEQFYSKLSKCYNLTETYNSSQTISDEKYKIYEITLK